MIFKRWIGRITQNTSAKQSQLILTQNSDLIKVFSKTAAAICIFKGPDHVYEFVNDEYLKLVGKRDYIGKPLRQIVPESQGQAVIALLNEVYRTGVASGGDETPIQIKDQNGNLKLGYYNFQYQPYFDDDGNVLGIVNTSIEVTEQVMARKRVEASEELTKENETLLKTITDNTSSSLFMMDEHGHPTFMNPAAEKLTGYKLEDIKNRPLHYAVHYRKPDGTPYPMEECPIDNAQAELKALQDQEEIFVDKNGRLFPVSFSVAPLEKDGKVIGSVLEFRDISEQKKIEADLRSAKDEAERANELKSAFLANMSHEIRTPLGAMLGFADLLRDPGLTVNERANFIDIMSRNGENLTVIINDILDLSKVEAGHLTLEFTQVDVQKVAAEVISLLRVKAKEKDLVLEYRFDSDSISTIVADATRLRQILLNLVGNAIKFTSFGSVELRGYSCKANDGGSAICFEIKDTGIGIPESKFHQIFEVFVQADNSMTRKFGGTGLGLALSRSLAREMGGDIEVVESIEGKGSTFKITIKDQPAKRNSQTEFPLQVQNEKLGEQPLEGLKILVVDDAPDNQQLIWRYLTKRGAIVESAENGFIGYRKALADNFDLVLMDIQMPVMDGYTATQKLRDAGYGKPILALTAHAMSEIRRKALNVGYTDHLTKPINVDELVSAIVRYTTVTS